MSKTRELSLDGGEHTELVLAALGTLSACEKLDATLLAGRSDAALDADDPVVLAALGLVALRRSLRRWLAEAAEPTRVDAPTQPAPPHQPPLGDLRR